MEKNHTGKEKENDWEKGDILDKVPWEGIPKDITCKQTHEWWWYTREKKVIRGVKFLRGQVGLGLGAQVKRLDFFGT